MATKNLIDAATSAKVEHFILLTSLGTNKVGFPAAILNLFWGVLIWKRKAEEALLASGLPYTIVRPGGMERPTDSFKETHNITLSEEDTLFGGLVSNLQVAELMAFMAKNPSLSCCKVVEVIAETTAPLTPMGELLKKIPSQRVCGFTEPEEADASQAVVSDITNTEKEPEEMKTTKAASLSPYTVYEDLKPPTSTTPTPSTGPGPTKASKIDITPTETSSTSSSVEVNSSETSSISINDVVPQTAPKKTYPLSPYINYEDLKPPSSPIPTPSGSKKEPSIASTSTEVASQLTEGNDIAKSKITDAGKDSTKTLATNHSPYLVYDDLKPPTSPSPSVPNVSGNNKPENPVDEKSGNIELHAVSKARPLSPYTMYEELKPPSSPMPSPKKF